jgi:hypothetical protein
MMGYFNAFLGDGPYFSLTMRDVKLIYENGFIELNNKNFFARISLVDHNPNGLKLEKGISSTFDKSGCEGVRIRRFPEKICPLDFKENQYYILRIQKKLFDELVEKSKISLDKMCFLHPRCKYDRFALKISGDY